MGGGRHEALKGDSVCESGKDPALFSLSHSYFATVKARAVTDSRPQSRQTTTAQQQRELTKDKNGKQRERGRRWSSVRQRYLRAAFLPEAEGHRPGPTSGTRYLVWTGDGDHDASTWVHKRTFEAQVWSWDNHVVKKLRGELVLDPCLGRRSRGGSGPPKEQQAWVRKLAIDEACGQVRMGELGEV